MKRITLAVIALALSAIPSHAQSVVLSDTFVFAGSSTSCAPITMWDGQTNPYPDDPGNICLAQGDNLGGFGSFLDVPFQLGYLNNGYLADCNAITWASKVFTLGDGTHNGDTFTVTGTTTCPYYTGEYGDYQNSNNLAVGFNVVASYIVVQHKSCGRYRCITYLTNRLQGGTGTVTESTIN